LAAVAPIAPWLDVHTRAVLARTHLLLGDPAAARMLLAEAQQVVDLVPDAPELRQQLDHVWEMVQHKPLSTRIGPSAITPAELRVLRLLPTHLSFAEISDRLFLTRNTVKTQAISTYRKLGVSSRGDAVTQARLLGLIPPELDPNDPTSV
jgi:LuxR family maltose regulon positive regulatory protein